ncbi:MAG TPA: DinB family protein [Pyrinomonadaceae bacterium]|nr:DinB family protein [Pyrinomonadaceae bacterium]
MEEFLKDFRRTVEEASARLLSMTESESEARPAPGAWSAKETIGHLIDSAANNHQRFVRAQFKEDLAFPGYEQDEWVAAQKYQQEPWPLIVNLWRAYNLHLAHVAANVPEEKLKLPRREHTLNSIAFNLVPETEPATLEYLIRDYLAHLKHHLGQITAGESEGR